EAERGKGALLSAGSPEADGHPQTPKGGTKNRQGTNQVPDRFEYSAPVCAQRFGARSGDCDLRGNGDGDFQVLQKRQGDQPGSENEPEELAGINRRRRDAGSAKQCR